MYSQKLDDFKKGLDSRKVLVIESAGVGQGLRNIIEKYKIHIDQASEVYAIVMLVVYGAMPSGAGFEAIHKLGIVSEIDFINLIADINKVVLGPIENQVKQSVTAEHELIQKNYEAKLNSGAQYDEALHTAQQNFVKDAGNTDEDFESVEETLARIDREIEDEIKAEIEQEMLEEAKAKQEAEQAKQTNQTIEPAGDKKPSPLNNFAITSTGDDEDVDLDLDQIPKTKAPTYIHTNMAKNLEDAFENNTTIQNQTINQSAGQTTSESTGRAINQDTTANEPIYHKDPYREEL